MAYDPNRGRTVMYGGNGGIYGTLGDTWEWDGTSWKILATGYAAEYLYEQGRLETTALSFPELRERAHVNARAQAADRAGDFSRRIRAAAALGAQRAGEFFDLGFGGNGVSPKANFDKAFRDAASWLPTNATFRCDFVGRQVDVKAALKVMPPLIKGYLRLGAFIGDVVDGLAAQASSTVPD